MNNVELQHILLLRCLRVKDIKDSNQMYGLQELFSMQCYMELYLLKLAT